MKVAPPLAYEEDASSSSSSDVDLLFNPRSVPILHVNGRRISDEQCQRARPSQTLLSFLRDELRLTGSKLGCGEGGCGACTVLISKLDGDDSKNIKHITVNACLFPILAADGAHITTIEGIGHVHTNNTTEEETLHPIQRAMAELHGSQCGFCTPGIIVALYGLLSGSSSNDGGDDGGPANVQEIEEHMDGNLCRCTGYRPIWDAARGLCKDVEDYYSTVRECGSTCHECPERNACTKECNITTGEEKKEDKTIDNNKMVVMTSKLNAMSVKTKPCGEDSTTKWWTQPYDMFPKDLLQSPNHTEEDGASSTNLQHEIQSRSLVVIDKSIHNGGIWYQPISYIELLDLLRIHGNGIKLVVGNTEVGIETKFKKMTFERYVHPPESIHCLYDILVTESTLIVGGCASLSNLQHTCHDLMAAKSVGGGDVSLLRTTKPTHDMLRWFASNQIRNVACLGGNLTTASPISDMNPLLCAHGATIILASRPRTDGGIERRHVSVCNFFLGYRTVDKGEIELIERVDIPLIRSKFEYMAPYKQARRREDDISIVTSGMRLRLHPDEEHVCWRIEDVCIAYGGMAPVTKVAKKTMSYLIGKAFVAETFISARKVLLEEFHMPDDVPGGQSQYRMTLAASFLHKFYLHCVKEIMKDAETDSSLYPPVPTISNDEEEVMAFISAPKPSITGTQSYPIPRIAPGLEVTKLGHTPNTKAMAAVDGVGQPAKHASGPLHCTGEALYTDDIPITEDTLHGYLIMSTRCHAKLVSLNVEPALSIPGVAGAFTAKDIDKFGGDNRWGPILNDDVVFLPIGDKIDHVGQVLGVVVGISQEIAEKGARAVLVEYEDLDGKAVVSIEDAIKSNSFWVDMIHELKRGGNVAELLQKTEIDEKKVVTVEGSMRTGGQEHFYLEPNTSLVVPSESATNLTIYTSTQAVNKTQNFCASVTNTPAAKVVCRMKRMGGGFGGKETRSVFVSMAAAVAAKLTNRPVRLTLNRDTDMSITGGRHAFLTKYKASAVIEVNGTVKLHAVDLKVYNNGGCKFDLTGPILDRCLLHLDNVYYWPHFHAVGTPCKTSQPPHTAFRGFGGPQGLVVAEHILDHLALACGISGDKLRRDNLYTPEQSTPFGVPLGGVSSGKWNVPEMWDKLCAKLDVSSIRVAAAEFNKKNKWTKRGVAVTPTKFGINFTAKFMNQGGALVHLYTDGSVLVSHGGTEMGQGLHTKVCQIAAQAFGIPLDQVYVNDTSSDKVANTIPSAASMSTDLYGMATLDACLQIIKRLQPIKDSLPLDATLKDIAKKAFYERVDLSAHGFYAPDNDRCGYDWNIKKPSDYPDHLPENSWKGRAFNYFTQGVSLSIVEIDVLTGDHRTLQTEILMDVGSSINPAIDIGQIEGAFVQGMGWSTMEEVVYSDDDHTWIRPRAKVLTCGPGTYKIPAFNDVPERFNVTILDSDNPFAVHSSKAIGEPPFFMGTSVFFAIKDAVTAARGPDAGYFEFRLPATSERIRMMCLDEISLECISPEDKSLFQPKGSF